MPRTINSYGQPAQRELQPGDIVQITAGPVRKLATHGVVVARTTSGVHLRIPGKGTFITRREHLKAGREISPN
jgi:hypothetical protein